MATADRTRPLSQFVARGAAGEGPVWDRVLFRRLGGCLAYVLDRLGFSPATVTVVGGACGVAGATVLGTATGPGQALVAAALLLLAYTLDCADGQLARATGRVSARGAWLDVTVDAVVTAFLAANLAFALTTDFSGSAWSSLLAGAFGASRAAGLLTGMQVKAAKRAEQRTGVGRLLKTAYSAAVETPFVYAALCASRLSADVLAGVVVGVTVLTVGRTAIAARRHFRRSDEPVTG